MTPFHKRLAIGGFQISSGLFGERIVLLRSDGASEEFKQQANGTYLGDADSEFTLVKTSNSYTLNDRKGNTETYNERGFILSEVDAAGNTTSYSYNTDEKLETVTGPFGHQLSFTYNATSKRIETVTLPDGKVLQYAYQLISSDQTYNLTSVIYPDTTTKTYHYENTSLPHHLTGITDQNGVRFATWEYDASGRAIRSEHAETTNATPQERFLFSWDAALQTTVTDPRGNQEVFKFNLAVLGRKTLKEKLNLADNKKLLQTFDTRNNLTSHTDEEGNKTTYTYNTANQRLSMTKAAGTPQARATSYTYYSGTIDLVATITKPSVASGQSAITTIGYNSDLVPESITQSGFRPDGSSVSRTVTLGYNSRGQVASIDGPRTDVSDITTFNYHSCTSGGECGQLASVTNSLNQTTTYNAYDAAGRIITMTDPWSVVTTYTYDDLGRLVEIKQTPQSGAVRTTGYSYNALGKLASVTTPAGTTLTYSYDNAHYLTSISDNLGNAVNYKYDLSGNRIEEKVINSGGGIVHTIQKTYDVRNNLQTLNNGGSLTQLVHNAIGNLVSHTDANNHVTTNGFNALNQLTQTIDALTNPINYSYDKQDNIVSVQSPINATTTYAYDDLGNLVSEVSPDRGTTMYTFDAAGNVLSQADARGVTVTMTYDALNRVLMRGYPGTVEDVAYVYDNCTQGTGRLCSVQDQSGTTAYTYDSFGNAITRIQTVLGINYTTQFAYNADDLLNKVTYPTGHVINYTRNVLGQITAVSMTFNGQTNPIISNASYTADGLLAEQTFGNGLLETRNYDTTRRLTTWQVSGVFSRTNTYDPVGNTLSRTLNSGTQTFTYDAMDRLLTDSGVGTNYTFTYDNNGNRLTADVGGVQSQCGYEFGSNRMNFLDGAPVLLDAAGNTLVQRGVTMTYNQANRLETIGSLGPFTYNADGQRTTKPAPSGTTVFHYSMDGLLLAETTESGSLIRVYFWAEDTPIAQMDTELTYLHADHLDTPRIATNSSGTIVWQWNSDGFGSLLPNEDPDGNGTPTTVNLRFPGQYFDKETNLHYNYFRDYDPRIGRYLESDPIGLEGGLNTFAYVESSPTNFIDSEGLSRNRGSSNPRSIIPNPGNRSGGWSYGRFYPSIGNAPPRTANYPVGSSRSQFQVPPKAQQPGGNVCGRDFSGHAFDQMQARGIPPSVVNDTLSIGVRYPGSTSSTSQYYNPVNNITVVVNHNSGNTVTVRWGPPSGLNGVLEE